ncbi:MAG TPA: glycosyltransferase family 4 protein [Methylomusa anaerophila]|uniref:Putative glycosyltransferase EpsD n=1 Tax=Methylomusa anaerophila TaxID=1930071 RepID=A0A348AGC6_9FIRM|nr:glycosyltransferase family 4 protein [Methylomusa anaerophila]BBB90124.1 putative glycosyltransferase EpsD [Methylomusa anaerophila]HML88152.1 glycosyltransferase family 4 protein [Methylomusa anaerophila]
MKKTKIAHIMTINWNMEKLLIDKMVGLKEKGYDVELISSGGEYVEKIRNRGFVYHTVYISRKIEPVKDLQSIYKLYKLFKTQKYDIVHTHTAKAGFTGRIAAKLAGIPLIIHTTHGLPFYEGQSKWKYNFYRLLEKFAATACHYIFNQNYDDYYKVINNSIKDEKHVYYEGNGVNVKRLNAIAQAVNVEEKKKELGLAADSFIIGYFARFEPVKGHKSFICAVEKLVADYKNVVCILGGRGPLEDEIKELVTAKKLDKHFKFLGFRDDVHELLKITDLVVLASEKEGIPRILMESMCIGTPVVATNVIGTKELVVDDECGLLVEYLDVDGLYNAMKTIYAHPEKRRQFVQNGKERIIKEFNEDVVVKRIHDKYQEILGNQRLKTV